MESGRHIDDAVEEPAGVVDVELIEDLPEARANVCGLMWFAFLAEEERGGVGVRESLGSKLKIGFEVLVDSLIERNNPVFAELAVSDGEGPLGEIDIVEVEVCELGDSESTGVEGVIGAVVAEPHKVAARVGWV